MSTRIEIIKSSTATVENSDASYTDVVTSGGTLILPDADIEVKQDFCLWVNGL